MVAHAEARPCAARAEAGPLGCCRDGMNGLLGQSPCSDHSWRYTLRELLKSVIPMPLLTVYREFRQSRLRRTLAGKSPAEVFSLVYARRLWGTSMEANHPFCSGSGSAEPQIVDTYVSAVSKWLTRLPTPPCVGDLGCGDFRVGARLRRHCGTYTAYDCVPSLLESNRHRWSGFDVSFEELDICSRPPAIADVFFVRQVLQHLSNDQILSFLRQIQGKCTFLVLTEHLAPSPFTANVDKPAGPDTRLSLASGVVLTAAPFDLHPLETELLCEVHSDSGTIVTHAYRLR